MCHLLDEFSVLNCLCEDIKLHIDIWFIHNNGKILIVPLNDKCGREVEECVEILDVAVMVDKHEMEIVGAGDTEDAIATSTTSGMKLEYSVSSGFVLHSNETVYEI